jgi:hypothetical protein
VVWVGAGNAAGLFNNIIRDRGMAASAHDPELLQEKDWHKAHMQPGTAASLASNLCGRCFAKHTNSYISANLAVHTTPNQTTLALTGLNFSGSSQLCVLFCSA